MAEKKRDLLAEEYQCPKSIRTASKIAVSIPTHNYDTTPTQSQISGTPINNTTNKRPLNHNKRHKTHSIEPLQS